MWISGPPSIRAGWIANDFIVSSGNGFFLCMFEPIGGIHQGLAEIEEDCFNHSAVLGGFFI